MLPSSPVRNSLCQRTGLNFIPHFSPVSCRPIRESTKIPDTPQESSQGQSICYNSNIPCWDDPSFYTYNYYNDTLLTVQQEPTLVEALPTFTNEEVWIYMKRLEEGYDLQHDHCYSLWVSLNTVRPQFSPCYTSPHLPTTAAPSIPKHLPGLPTTSASSTPNPLPNLEYTSVLSGVIDHRNPVIQCPQIEPKSSARVLTSEENRKMLLEKEIEKKEKAVLKEERKQKEF